MWIKFKVWGSTIPVGSSMTNMEWLVFCLIMGAFGLLYTFTAGYVFSPEAWS